MPRPAFAQLAAVAALVASLATPLAAQDSGAVRRRCPTCAPARTRPAGDTAAGAGRVAPARRGAGGATRDAADVSITLGTTRQAARVDAECAVDERATPTNGRAYLRAMYPWFGQRPAPDQPQWRFTLEVRRPAAVDAYDQFVFSFSDGPRSGVIQTVAGSQRMGSGTVTVTRHGAGARFDVAGRTDAGEPIRATVDCARLGGGAVAGG